MQNGSSWTFVTAQKSGSQGLIGLVFHCAAASLTYQLPVPEDE